MNDLSERTTVVVGASRGLGRGIATAFAAAGAPVVAVARSADALSALGEHDNIEIEIADATEATVAESVLERHNPSVLVVVAGAIPVMRPLQHQTWETFSTNWHADVRIAFQWLREALRMPLSHGGRVIVFSSGAAVAGSPLSGGYAGAKATQRFITAYAREEAIGDGLGITFTAVLPRITPATGLGRSAIEAYAARGGQSQEEYLQRFGEPLTTQGAAAAVLDLVRREDATVAPAYLLTGDGLKELA